MAQDSGRAAEHGYGTARSGSAAQGSARARSLSTQNKPFMTSPQSDEVIVLGGGKGGTSLCAGERHVGEQHLLPRHGHGACGTTRRFHRRAKMRPMEGRRRFL